MNLFHVEFVLESNIISFTIETPTDGFYGVMFSGADQNVKNCTILVKIFFASRSAAFGENIRGIAVTARASLLSSLLLW